MNALPTDPPEDVGAKELERLKNELDILAARVSAVAALRPNTEGAPKGEIVLGDKAGSLAPWLANRVFADVAELIAGEVAKIVPDGRVLVTDDANLLAGDLVSHQLHVILRQRTEGLTGLVDESSKAVNDLNRAINKYTEDEKANGSSRHLLASASNKVDDAPADAEGEPAGDEGPKGGAAPETSAVGIVLDLVRMAAVDYELTAASVSTEAGLLPRLTAGFLAATGAPAPVEPEREAFYAAVVGAHRASEDALKAAQTAKEVSGEDAATSEARAAERAAATARRDADTAWAKVANPRASLVRGPVVLLDGFAGIDPDGTTLEAFTQLSKEIDDVASGLLGLRIAMSPVEAEVTRRRAEIVEARTKWEGAVAEKEPNVDQIAELKAQVDELGRQVDRRASAIAPAQTFLDHANARIAAAVSAIVTITTPDAAGTSPLLRACSRERLHTDQHDNPDEKSITHVLYVGSTHLGADVITRRSILGSSGRLGFLGGANASWTLLDAAAGAVVNGGAEASAQSMTYDLGSAKYEQGPTTKVASGTLASDPLERIEGAMRLAVVAAAFALLVLSFAAVIALFI